MVFELFPCGQGWKWRLICHKGRELMVSQFSYTSQKTALEVVRKLRANFFSLAEEVDYRQGACI